MNRAALACVNLQLFVKGPTTSVEFAGPAWQAPYLQIVWSPEVLSLQVTVLKARVMTAGSTREDAGGEVCRQGKRWPCCSATRRQRSVSASDCQWQWQLCLHVRTGVEAAANTHLFWVSSEGREVALCPPCSSGL